MPIDAFILNAMLDPFRNMVEDCKKNQVSGPDFDKMCATLARLEALGQEQSDINTFNGMVMQENLYGLFSDYYGRALSAQAKQKQTEAGEGAYDDAYLLKQCVDALKQAIVRLRESYEAALEEAKGKKVHQQMEAGMDYFGRTGDQKIIAAGGGIEAMKKRTGKDMDQEQKERPNVYDSTAEVEALQNPEPLIGPIQDLIDLGEQPGMTLPRFLREQIERGLDKAAEGTSVARGAWEYHYEIAEVLKVSPHEIEKHRKKLEVFQTMAAAAPFGVPMAREVQWAMDDVDREFEPSIIRWNKMRDYMESLLDDLHFWSLSYCSFAPYLMPWSLSEDPVAATVFTQNTQPGIFREREKLWKKYFGLEFMDIFKHEIFKWEVVHSKFQYSQQFTVFMIEKLYEQCRPMNHLSRDMISERENFFGFRGRPDYETNPDILIPGQRWQEFYNRKFGAGRYESKYKAAEKGNWQAAPWNLESFSYGK